MINNRKEILIVYIIVMLPACIFLLQKCFFSYGENVLVAKSIISLCYLISGIAGLCFGIKELMKKKRSWIITIFMLMFGGILCTKIGMTYFDVYKDIKSGPQTYVLERCSVERVVYNRSSDRYYLEGLCNGKKLSFDVSGADENFLYKIEREEYSILVTAYPNTKAVKKFEIYREPIE